MTTTTKTAVANGANEIQRKAASDADAVDIVTVGDRTRSPA